MKYKLRFVQLVFVFGMVVGATVALPLRASAASIPSTTHGRSCVARHAAMPSQVTSGVAYSGQLNCIINPADTTQYDYLMNEIATTVESGTGTLRMDWMRASPAASSAADASVTYTLYHGDLYDGDHDLVASNSTGHGSIPDNMFVFSFTGWTYGATLALASAGRVLGFSTLNASASIGLDQLQNAPCIPSTDTLGNAQSCLFGATVATYGGATSLTAAPNWFGASSPYDPTPCEGVDTTLVVEGVDLTEPITSETITPGELVQVRVSIPSGAPNQTARLDFIPDTSVPTGRRTLGTWSVPVVGGATHLINVTSSFQAFGDEDFTLSRTAVRCESEWGFGYDTFDGTDPWGATPLDGATPTDDEDERDLQACFSGSGIGFNPSSWVPAAGRMFSCTLVALLVPDSGVVEDRWESLEIAASEGAPISWAVNSIAVAEGVVVGLDGAIEANSSDCVYVLPSGTDEFPHDGLFDFCPAELVATEPQITVWRDRAGAFLLVSFFLLLGAAALKIVTMGGSGGGSGSAFQNEDGDYGEHGRYTLI